MSAVCFYFQVHQPFRIRRFRFAEVGSKSDYFDDAKNSLIFNKVSQKCYLKTNSVLKEMILQHQGKFRVSFSITGMALEQMSLYAKEVLLSFQDLVSTGCVEILGETYNHSLASIYHQDEFFEQIETHRLAMKKYFSVSPVIFRNTELIYNDYIGKIVHQLGYKAILAEGADDIMGWRSPNFVYHHPEVDLKILTKNYKLSDDIAFRFSNRNWNEYPLFAEKFTQWVHAISGNGDTVNLFMDYETFGEHQWEDTGMFNFLKKLPECILSHPDWEFLTPSQVIEKYPAIAPLHYSRLVSWADMERDTTAWNGNEMQNSALQRVYRLSNSVQSKNNQAVIKTWKSLLTSDHFYYMCTKFFSDGDVHAYFSPFKSPYEAFLSYMAVLDDFEQYLQMS